MTYRKLHNIGLTILLIGLLNIYNIIKEGTILKIGQIIKIESFNIKIIIFITIVLSIIINFSSILTREFNSRGKPKSLTSNSSNFEVKINRGELYKESKKIEEKDNSIEYDLLIGFSLIGLILITLSNDLIFIYLGLELYSYAIYILILVKETILIRRISIIYLILSSLMSALILYSFSLLYKFSGSLNLEYISNIISNTTHITSNGENGIDYIIYLILLGFLFKLGTGPFIYWVLRVYSELSKKILWYQLTIPKFIFFILLLKFMELSSYNNSLIYIIYFIAILSIIIGTIGGLFQNKDNMLLSYSSILNIGYILLSFTFIINYFYISSPLTEIRNLLSPTIYMELWILIQFFIVYIINLLGLFSILFLFSRSSFIFNFRSFFSNPFFYISQRDTSGAPEVCFIILILSFIGFPPLSGFFSKFYLFYSLFSYPNLTTISVLIFILSTLISSFFYFKFLFSSSIDSNSSEKKIGVIYQDTKISIILAFTTLFTLLYPFYFSSLYPFFNY
jgi:NADH-quinone oxidoreductase subunit N